MQPVRTIIFAKAPRPGLAKTRLIPALNAEGAANLARRMLDSTVDSALAAELGPIELRVTPAIDTPEWHGVTLPSAVAIGEQGAGDLGARLARAAEQAVARGETVLLIGTDCVEMSAALLREAAAALRRHDAVLYPTVDGGYALLGLNRYHPLLFSDIAWSTDTVAFDTTCRIARLGWSLRQGSMLHDVDEPADLRRLPAAWVSPGGVITTSV
ncbi:TIGR04282 family arsenosugar biosynthesis glycosyltransferase [Pseudogulbenkiania subflava]|uniref:Glycosyltransferase n=1 Tax=Pseudogulbenkiania subflava DSM 22618 TaxID=1123014 RepID=A0A1Y6BVI8_9NEIS|nr:TIGR04282 family arsenosugar biosynthesis glycosyltransferase [Pseudogulbenkiania subflava]SMF23278.1 hypothetical protein SAMN02745746_02033 [Pseudogulbenkiania subflava DSM 22618]SMF32629.1 hypothetical protein SAMN02745746_02581 [Pseudogulbenkiania subflava DSM 22618]SMF47671.1 hypothetical protein SAMN02745746_03510 [Pseudogulbenkiania subflava DSM 22618]